MFEAEYVVEIPTAILASSDYNEKVRSDPTLSARVTIRQYVSETYSGGLPYVAVHYYQGRWERLDPAVTATQLRINAVCWGEFLDTGATCNNNTWSPSYINPGSGTWRSYTPSWAGRYVSINDAYHQSGSTKVWLKRGTTTWTFTVTVTAPLF